MQNKTDKLMIKMVFEELKNGNFPKFGSPETKCEKCMFSGISCFPGIGVVGCLGGWKKEGENSETR